MITILTGDNNHKIGNHVKELVEKLEPAWRDCNYHRFPADALDKAMNCALTLPFGNVDSGKLVVVEDCNFKQLQLEKPELESLSNIPPKTELVLVASSIDKRLKIVKSLLTVARLIEFNTPPPWQTGEIASSLQAEAKAIGLPLSTEVRDYLAEAIGNDTARAEKELQKLAVYASGNKLTLAEVRSLVPEQTQSSLQLADAIRRGQTSRVQTLLKDLENQATSPPLVICRTLQTQFRTWLWVKAAIASGIKQDSLLASSCQIANPKRVYYLKQDVAAIPLKSLSEASSALLNLEVALKSSYSSLTVLCCLLDITRLFTR